MIDQYDAAALLVLVRAAQATLRRGLDNYPGRRKAVLSGKEAQLVHLEEIEEKLEALIPATLPGL